MAKLLKPIKSHHEINYLSTISYTNREHNVPDTPSHLYNKRSGISMALLGGLRLSLVRSKEVKFMLEKQQCKGLGDEMIQPQSPY
jgi:hypothetical protein